MKPVLHIDVTGQGPDLVLLHGWGLNAEVWSSLLAELTPHFRLHLVDLPGFGHSPLELVAEFSLNELADAVLAAVPEKAYWLGWSMGGLVATQAALNHPSRVQGLILVASSPRFLQDGSWKGIRPDVLEMFTEQLDDDLAATLDRFLAIQAMGSASLRKDMKTLRNAVLSRPLPDKQALRKGLNILAETDLRPQLAELQCRVLRIYGRLDSLAPPTQAVHLAELEEAHHEVISGAAHAPFISHRDEFLESLLAFTELNRIVS